MKKILLGFAVLAGLIGVHVFTTHAQTVPPISPFIYTSSSSVSTISATTTVGIKNLGGSGTKCVQVNNSGTFQDATGACGSGSGGGLASTTPFTIGGLTVVSSSGALSTISSSTYLSSSTGVNYFAPSSTVSSQE